MLLEGRVAIVTGGAHGIGRATVDVFLREGAQVVSADWSEARDLPAGVFALRVDISREADARATVEQAVARFGRLDILVNNAGIQTYGDAVETEEELWDRTLNVNVKGAWWMTKFSVPAMRESTPRGRSRGAVVNVSSVQGFVSQRGACAYGVSKHAMLGLTRTTALDFAPEGIRVNCVCPGSVDTPMLRHTIEIAPDPAALEETIRRMHPVGRMGEPLEVAEVICFLASERASFMNGSMVVVDGGLITTVGGSPSDEPS